MTARRKTAHPSSASHSMYLGPECQVHSDGDHRLTMRPITVLRPASRPIEIGELLHRHDNSGYPCPYEVWVHATGARDFYPDVAAAEAGAKAFAAEAFRVNRGRELWVLGDLIRPYALAHPVCPTCGHELPAPTPEEPQP